MMKILSLALAVLWLGSGSLLAQSVPANYPAWWYDGTIPGTSIVSTAGTHAVADNYGPVNVGQLKWVATRAKNYLDVKLASVGGSQIDLTQFFPAMPATNDPGYAAALAKNYTPANVGQLKALTKLFYSRLNTVGYDTNAYLKTCGFPPTWASRMPWSTAYVSGDNYKAANLGQLKVAFGFNLDGQNTFDTGVPVDGLALWLKADIGVVADANGRVSKWVDQSGSAIELTQSTASLQPVVVANAQGGRPAVSFDGSTANLKSLPIDLFQGSSDYTVFAVFNPAASQQQYADILDYDHGFGNGFTGVVLQMDYMNTARYYLAHGDGSTWWFNAASVAPTAPNLIAFRKQGNQIIAESVDTSFAAQANVQPLNVSPLPRKLTIGSHTTGVRYFSGQVSELILFRRALNPKEYAKVEAYLSKKYAFWRNADLNGNGLDDHWEFFTGPAAGSGPSFASTDPDGDGLTNLDEYLFGLNPLSPETQGVIVSSATRAYSYDAEGRLIGANQGVPETFSYDEEGNLLQSTGN
jgi:YD repeat-containing protein